VDEGDNSPILYCLLSSSVKVSKRTIGLILEQVRPLCPFYRGFVIMFVLYTFMDVAHSYFLYISFMNSV
jgi:hypothetical protein